MLVEKSRGELEGTDHSGRLAWTTGLLRVVEVGPSPVYLKATVFWLLAAEVICTFPA